MRVDSQNRLIITEPFQGKEREVSFEGTVVRSGGKKRFKRIVLDGRWSLTPEYKLKFRLLGSKSPVASKSLIFSGDIENVTGSGLTFRVRGTEPLSGIKTGTIQLKGRWQADSNNRITFQVARSKGEYDILRFQGAWHVTRRNELVYHYTRTALKTKTRHDKTLVFKGFWDLGKGRLVYRFERSNDSFFSFKAGIESKSLLAKDGAIKYQLGIKYTKNKVYREFRQIVTIYGVWKLGKDLKVAFDVAYTGRKQRAIKFQVDKLIGDSNSLAVSLKKETGEQLGIEVTFMKIFKNDAELFLSLSKFAAERRISGGVRIKF